MLDHFHLDRFHLIPGLLRSGATIYASLRMMSFFKFQNFRRLQADWAPLYKPPPERICNSCHRGGKWASCKDSSHLSCRWVAACGLVRLLLISFIIAKLKSPYRGGVYCRFLGSFFCPCFLIRNCGLGIITTIVVTKSLFNFGLAWLLWENFTCGGHTYIGWRMGGHKSGNEWAIDLNCNNIFSLLSRLGQI